ncbi:MAG: SPOR domain-containing protein [bacterium]|nr:SPOR domain-containing protein [bacterium]
MGKAGTTAATVRPGLRFLDRLILFVAWIVTCGLVYGLGFYTGKGTQERRLGMEERVVRLPVTAAVPPEGQRPKASNEFSFYETLATQRAADGGRPHETPREEPPTAAAPPPAPASAAAAPAAVPVGEPLPHPTSSPGAAKPSAVGTGTGKPPAVAVGEPKPPATTVAAPATGASTAVAKPALPTPLGAPKPVAVASGQAKPPVRARPDDDGVIPPTPRAATGTARAAAPIPTTPAAATRPAGAAATTAPAARPATPPGAMVALAQPPAPAAPKRPTWTVQASPTRDKQEADRLLAALKARGYDANVVTVRRDGDVWYRLRVGRYASPEQATEAMRKLRGAGVSHAFVASE